VALTRQTTHPLRVFPEAEVVQEEQKSVSELLSKFGLGKAKQRTNKAQPSKADLVEKVVLRKVEGYRCVQKETGVQKVAPNRDLQRNGGGSDLPAPPPYYTFWGNENGGWRLISNRQCIPIWSSN
jgi:hypothetical protein